MPSNHIMPVDDLRQQPVFPSTPQTREHLFCYCKRWKNEQRELWRAVGRVTGWKAGKCRHLQISELFSMEIQAVIDFLAATEIGKFPSR
jgi:hypothetical protein